MADTASVTPPSAAAGVEGASSQRQNKRRQRKPKPRSAEASVDAATSADNQATQSTASESKPRERRRERGKSQPKQGEEKTYVGASHAGAPNAATAAEPAIETKQRHKTKERKPKKDKPVAAVGDNVAAAGDTVAGAGDNVAAEGAEVTAPPSGPATEAVAVAATTTATASAADVKREKTEPRESKSKHKTRKTKETNADTNEDEGDDEKKESEPPVVVEWKTAPWFTGCGSDLGTCYWVLSRCLACNDVATLASEEIVRRAVALQSLLGRLKSELLPLDELEEELADGERKTEWTTGEILNDVVALLAGGGKTNKSVVVTALEGEVVDATTELLLSRVGRHELKLLEKWALHLESLLQTPVKTKVSKHDKGAEATQADTVDDGADGEKNDGEDGDDDDDDDDDGEDDGAEKDAEQHAEQGVEAEEKETATGGGEEATVESAAALLPSARGRKGRGGSNSALVHAKAQVAAAIAFHKAYEQRTTTGVSSATSTSLAAATQVWTSEVHGLFASTRVTPSDEASRLSVAAQIQNAFRRSPQWRRCEVLLFGSSLSKFGAKSSDLDLCLRANPDNNGDRAETAAAMSVRELRLRMRRTQQQERDGYGQLTAAGAANSDPQFLAETMGKSLKAVEAMINGLEKLRKKTKTRSAAKEKRLVTMCAHWDALVAALRFYCDEFSSDKAIVPGSNSSTAKQEAAAYHDALHKQQRQRQRDIYAAAALLKRLGCVVDLVVAHARVPVIGFTHPASGFECDLCFENYHACINTLLLRTYAECDDRARALGIAIKHWAKKRGINDASTGHLSSYSFILLVIYFLQTKAQILPNLQHPELLRRANVAPVTLKGVDASFCSNVDLARAFHLEQLGQNGGRSPSTETVGELLLSFFQFYVDGFDFSELVVSVRHPEKVQTKAMRWAGKNKLKSWRISVQDPLETDRDLGSVLQFRCQLKILEEMKRALALLRDGESFETRVCEAAVVAKSKNGKATDKKQQQQQQQRRGGEKPRRDNGAANAKSGGERGGNNKGGRRQDNAQQPEKSQSHANAPSSQSRSQQEPASGNRAVVRGRVDKPPPQTAPENTWRRSDTNTVPNPSSARPHKASEKRAGGRGGRRSDGIHETSETTTTTTTTTKTTTATDA